MPLELRSASIEESRWEIVDEKASRESFSFSAAVRGTRRNPIIDRTGYTPTFSRPDTPSRTRIHVRPAALPSTFSRGKTRGNEGVRNLGRFMKAAARFRSFALFPQADIFEVVDSEPVFVFQTIAAKNARETSYEYLFCSKKT